MRSVLATRYVTPLREGGSLPGLVEADDDGMYVVKFRGAGQGPKALIAELIASEIGRSLKLPIPDVVLIELDAAMGRAEPDPEIHDLLVSSEGTNVGIDFLPGALSFSAADPDPVDPVLAASIVWFDAYLMNVDRSPRNPNLLLWHDDLKLIDHGAALYVHHAGGEFTTRAGSRFPQIRDHVLLPRAVSIAGVSDELASRIDEQVIREIVESVPETWFAPDEDDESIAVLRSRYVRFLLDRLDQRDVFVEEADRARA